MPSTLPDSNLSRAARYAVPFALLSIPVWLSRVNSVVPEPYLDEVFHVPQAQAYWAHQWSRWDPKITTPPGLYLWSYILCGAALLLRGTPKTLDAPALRSSNAAAAAVFLPWRLQTLLDSLRNERNKRPVGSWLSHTVLNICLFPPLFFFSGLYYTDILALLAAIEAYNWDLNRNSSSDSNLFGTWAFVASGLTALIFRQTNIFWVAIFLGGQHVVRIIRKSSKLCETCSFRDIPRRSMQNELYDPLVSQASIADYAKVTMSLTGVCLGNTRAIIVSILPYLIILSAFGGFVLWNNGVVLGHKEFHIASIHFAQMLYIWPYFGFFSWPILILPTLNLIIPDAYIPNVLYYGFPKRQKGLPGLLTTSLVGLIMLGVVHFNTIVHPFTFADNRHYVFYAFRLLLNHHPAVKYLAVVVYFVCAWMAISAFGFSTISTPPAPRLAQIGPEASNPASAKEGTTKESREYNKTPRKPSSKKTSQPEETQGIPAEALEQIRSHILQRQQEQKGSARVSFVIVWLITTSLSLITATLVEPRYFIIPWVMWRLHLPPQPVPRVYRHKLDERKVFQANFETHLPVLLETIWFLVINVLTGYVFLYKGFEWPQEPGKIQRFMW